MNKKIKLALGLTLGAIVSTAAITTMAVSCGDPSDSNSNSNSGNGIEKNNGIITSIYNPSPEIKAKFPEADFNKLVDIQTKMIKMMTENPQMNPSGAQEIKYGKVEISLIGSVFSSETNSTQVFVNDKGQKVEYISKSKNTINLTPDSNGKYTQNTFMSLVFNPPYPGDDNKPITSTQQLTKEQLEAQFQLILSGKIPSMPPKN